MRQLPKSTPDIPFLICSFGSILSEGKIIAKKFFPLMTFVGLTFDTISLFIFCLNSDIVISDSGLSVFTSIFSELVSLILSILSLAFVVLLVSVSSLVLSESDSVGHGKQLVLKSSHEH